ncbi:MAG: hypothetical protein IPL23_04675 [Saprospiraceae bacterium]|nr:hypothetical protein [Saprospiraceae bacterium]
MYKFAIFSFACLLLLNACADESSLGTDTSQDSLETGTYANVDRALWQHFKAFEDEAASRGFSINLNQLKIRANISEISENGVLGQCQYNSHLPNQVTIDKTFWNRSSELYKEFVVFHELGHCVLDRNHKEDKDSRGRCLSIMRSGLGDCLDAYSSVNRTYYLNELFNEGN